MRCVRFTLSRRRVSQAQSRVIHLESRIHPPRRSQTLPTSSPRLQRIGLVRWGVRPGIDPCPEYRSIVDHHSDRETFSRDHLFSPAIDKLRLLLDLPSPVTPFFTNNLRVRYIFKVIKCRIQFA